MDARGKFGEHEKSVRVARGDSKQSQNTQVASRLSKHICQVKTKSLK